MSSPHFLHRGIFPSQSSILSTMMFVIMVTVTTSLVFIAVTLAANEKSFFRQIGIRSITTLANVIGSNSMAALAFSDQKVGGEILHGLTSEPEIVLGCLYTKQGRLFATYSAPSNADPCPGIAPSLGPHFANGNLLFTKEISQEGDGYGFVHLVSNMQTYYQQFRVYAILLGAILITAILIAYLLALRLQGLVTEPVLKLAKTAQYISEKGEYTLRAESTNELEINILVSSFNRMLDVIHEREEKLLQSEEQFRTAFDLAAVGHVLLAPGGKFLRVNPEVCKVFGYTKDEFLKMQFLDITHPDDRADSHDAFSKLASNEIPSFTSEKRYLTKNKDLVWAIVSAAPVSGPSGKVHFVISVIQDITDRKMAEQERDRLLVQERQARLEAEKSIRVRDEFLSIASHELRTPLTPIKMQLQMVKLQIENAQEQQLPQRDILLKSFEISERQVGNLEQLIQDLLDVSRITAGRMVLNLQSVDLAALVQEVLDRMRYEILKSGSPVTTHFATHPKGLWDPLRIEQIFLNLLSNALKYGNSGSIDILISSTDREAQLVVQDHGIGIAKEDQVRIFERFERVAPLKHYAGLGLGLYITSEIVKAHHGTLQVESELGRGSRFTVSLPLTRSNS